MKVYRGYNKDYPNWGTRNGQNHIWATDDLDFAKMYANEFDNKGLVEFEIDDNKVNLADASDYEDLISDEFGGDPLDADNEVCDILKQKGFNLLYFDDYGKEVYLILDTDLITNVKEITLDEQVNEFLKIAGCKLDEAIKSVNKELADTKLITSEYEMFNYMKNNNGLRILYDKKNQWYLADDVEVTIHNDLFDDAVKDGLYPDVQEDSKKYLDTHLDQFYLFVSHKDINEDERFNEDRYKFVYDCVDFCIFTRDDGFEQLPLYAYLKKPERISII